MQCSSQHQQTNTQFFTGQMPFLSPNQQCQTTEGKFYTILFTMVHTKFYTILYVSW